MRDVSTEQCDHKQAILNVDHMLQLDNHTVKTLKQLIRLRSRQHGRIALP